MINFDPRQLSGSSIDSLADVPFHDISREDEDPPLSHSGCRHKWAIKRHQSSLPDDGNYAPLPSTTWCLACYCMTCRYHLDLTIRFGNENAGFNACPSITHPLHHFVFLPGQPETRSEGSSDVGSPVLPSFPKHFRCTSAYCNARLIIQFRSPRLKSDWISLLTERHIVKSRDEKVIAEDPEKFQGHALPSPASVLETLGRLIYKALNESEPKPYPRDSKNWLLKFGDSCAGMMEQLGFRSDVTSL